MSARHAETKTKEEIKKIEEEMGIKIGDRVDDGDLSPDEELMLMADDLGKEKFQGICVQTTNKQIQDTLKHLREKDPIALAIGLQRIHDNLDKYPREVLLELDGTDWQNWCDDLCLYFATRAIVQDKPIPMAPKKMFNDIVGQTDKSGVGNPEYGGKIPKDKYKNYCIKSSDGFGRGWEEHIGEGGFEYAEIFDDEHDPHPSMNGAKTMKITDFDEWMKWKKDHPDFQRLPPGMSKKEAKVSKSQKKKLKEKKKKEEMAEKIGELREMVMNFEADDDNLTKVMSMVNEMLREAEEKELYFGMEYDSVDGIIDVVKELLDQAESNQKSIKKLSKTVSDLTTDLVEKSKGFQTARRLDAETKARRDEKVKELKKENEELKEQISQIANIPFHDFQNGEMIETEINKIFHPEIYAESETETESESDEETFTVNHTTTKFNFVSAEPRVKTGDLNALD
jgi:hypothetical protein